MTTPIDPISDDGLEARLRASWERAVMRAGDDLAATDLVSVPLAAGRRRPRWRAATGALVGVAAILLIGVALIVGSGGRRDPAVPPASPAVPVGSPAPAPGSPGPDQSATPDDQVGTPVLSPSETFPPSIDGRPVVPVGPEADARIAAATDDSPILVSGWLLGTDRRGCPDFDSGSPGPDGVLWKDCAAIPIRATRDGGASLPVHPSVLRPMGVPLRPPLTQVKPVLVQVHVRDAGCTAADCAHKAVFDKVLMYGASAIALPFLGLAMPAGGIPMEQAVAIALRYAKDNKIAFGAPVVLLSAEAGPHAIVADDSGSGKELDWVWVVRVASDDGFQVFEVYVGYLDGSERGYFGGSLESFP